MILVTLDTTRADAVSAERSVGPPYGPQVTPVLDTLAEEGARFARAYTHAPSTLSSHAAMFTGLDPHGHGIPRNGYPLDAALPTLAVRLHDAGYETVGVVGAAVLARDTGIARGFDRYDDDLDGWPEARAEVVVRRALAAVDAREHPERPLFLWVHLYDPHAPYAPPPPFDRLFVGPSGVPTPEEVRDAVRALAGDAATPEQVARINGAYLGEVAYADTQLGSLLDQLGARGLLSRSLLVVAGDHGEALGDDPVYAWSHGNHVSDDVMQVPLMVVGRGLPIARGIVVRSQVANSGLGPTVLDLVGVDAPLGETASFASLVRAGPVDDTDGWPSRPTRPILLEAGRPRGSEATEGWNDLPLARGVAAGGWTVTLVPFLGVGPTFGDGGLPPAEGVRDVLVDLVRRWDLRAPDRPEPLQDDAHTRALRALGYVE